MGAPSLAIRLRVLVLSEHQDTRRARFVGDALKEGRKTSRTLAVDDDQLARRERDTVRDDFGGDQRINEDRDGAKEIDGPVRDNELLAPRHVAEGAG